MNMGVLDTKEYYPEVIMANLPLEDYYNKDRTFGKFTENGAAYVIENKNTPRPWLQFLCNDKIFSCVTNTGGGFIRHIKGCNLTKEWSQYYLIREPYGKRELFIELNGERISFFDKSEDFTTTVRPGTICFEGKIEDIAIKLLIFVPENIPCECWRVEIENQGEEKNIKVIAQQDWQFNFLYETPEEDIKVSCNSNVAVAKKCGMKGVFSANDSIAMTEKTNEKFPDGSVSDIVGVSLEREVNIAENESVKWYVVSGACEDDEEEKQVLGCVDEKKNNDELNNLLDKWKCMIERNYCELPDKNTEYFLNYWLKNQLYLTYRYDRADMYVGYRDGLQDSWGYLLVDPAKAKEKIITTLSYMMPDGRCPRQYYRWDNNLHDMRDFSDSIIWAADALTGYIKETGDFGIFDEKIPFLGSDEISTVENHVFRGLDSLYTLRGKNGLVRVRGGDWFDGLGGINKYGDDATSTWITIAAFYAQNVMSELYEYIGEQEKAELMRTRSEEYKKIVNEVSWDGNWFTYAFFEDGEPIGSSKNLEGKIYLNAQTWAMFTGIVDDKDKIRRMEKAINRYLQTPFGPLLNYPPYVFYGERCGRVQRQRQGTFGNSAVYNHAASFKVYADVSRGDYDDALDTLQRALPNHVDNSDMCRTSEPYAVGNVYYGPNNSRFGMNLFSWFTATAAWLIHDGFEEILGVKAGYDGLVIEPHICSDWNEFKVSKKYRNTMYHILFERSTEKGIWVDGIKQEGNCIKSDKNECEVIVRF